MAGTILTQVFRSLRATQLEPNVLGVVPILCKRETSQGNFAGGTILTESQSQPGRI